MDPLEDLTDADDDGPGTQADALQWIPTGALVALVIVLSLTLSAAAAGVFLFTH